jgi:RNA polymerase subunit RPABC4/transcription elongation factor Spt4
MRKSIVVIGVVLVALGLIAYFLLMIPVNSGAVLVSSESLTVTQGSNAPRIFRLPLHADVRGTISTVTGQSGDIDFYVFDKDNYDMWRNGQSYSDYLYIYRARNGTIFFFTGDGAGDYYFVFNNPVGFPFGADRFVSWSASYDYRPYEPYTLPIFASLVIPGILLIVWVSYTEYRRRQKLEQQRVCSNCGKAVSIDKMTCPYCGFNVGKSIRCRYCKTIYDRSQPKCPNCGAKNA